jgi:spermidine/putrescine transport system permease protein
LQTFWQVIIPLTKPGIYAGVLLVFVPAIGMFAITDLMGGARVPLIGNVIQNQFFQARDWPFGAALGVMFTVLFGVIYWLMQRRGAAATGHL